MGPLFSPRIEPGAWSADLPDDPGALRGVDCIQRGDPAGIRTERVTADEADSTDCDSMKLFLAARSLLFLVLIPGTVAGYIPWRILRRRQEVALPALSISSGVAAG